ncbi:MAG: hypothetical protein IJH90_06180 [Mogibacterium sp.]|nr:hypothetical protein [Mogibacterium sp.]
MLRVQEARARELDGYENRILKKHPSSRGNVHYCFREKGFKNHKYLGTAENVEVNKIKEAHYLKLSRKIIKKNLDAFNKVIQMLEDVDYDSVNGKLPEIYRGAKLDFGNAGSGDERCRIWKQRAVAYKAKFAPYRPEDLKYKTVDGTWVRSYSEVVIYNLLLYLGLTFVYELPLVTKIRKFLPDFTILSEKDYTTTIIIEHQGMMSDPKYRNKFRDRVYEYLMAGYVQGVNIFYTFDLYDSGVDTDPVLDIINLKIRPLDRAA